MLLLFSHVLHLSHTSPPFPEAHSPSQGFLLSLPCYFLLHFHPKLCPLLWETFPFTFKFGLTSRTVHFQSGKICLERPKNYLLVRHQQSQSVVAQKLCFPTPRMRGRPQFQHSLNIPTTESQSKVYQHIPAELCSTPQLSVHQKQRKREAGMAIWGQDPEEKLNWTPIQLRFPQGKDRRPKHWKLVVLHMVSPTTPRKLSHPAFEAPMRGIHDSLGPRFPKQTTLYRQDTPVNMVWYHRELSYRSGDSPRMEGNHLFSSMGPEVLVLCLLDLVNISHRQPLLNPQTHILFTTVETHHLLTGMRNLF